MVSNYRALRLESRELYKNLKKLNCPALENETVHFNSVGFNHIIRKGKDIRPIADQIRRFKMLPHAVIVLLNGKLTEHRIIKNKKIIKFWTVSHEVEGEKLNVVVIQEGNGQKYFLSITNKN